MKKIVSVFICILFILTILLPVGTILFACLGYTFRLANITAFIGILAGLSICVLVLDFLFKITVDNKFISVLLSIITPLSLINTAFCIFIYNQFWIILTAWISVGCCCFLTIRHGKPFSLKLTTLIIAAAMAMPILLFSFFSFISFLMGDFGKTTVVQTLDSPTGKYYAQVISNDQGAMGGNTTVHVYETKELNTILFTIKKEPQQVYVGDWDAYEDMEIYWESDNSLVINSVSHKIK